MKKGFYREVRLGDSRITIELEYPPVSEGLNSLFFGFPLFDEKLKTSIDSPRGYFLSVTIKENKIEVINDICGGYRLYHIRIGHDYHLSDNYRSLLNKLDDNGLQVVNDYEKIFWKRQRYCTGSSTWFERLKKMAPATKLTITEEGLSNELLFPDLPNKANREKHCALSIEELKAGLVTAAGDSEKRLLFFSGGADSTLLALILRELKIEFTAIFLKAKPSYRSNFSDFIRAENVAKEIGLELVTIEVDISGGLANFEQVIERMMFDRHFALLHFVGLKNLAKSFNPNTLIISGQAADSILSFGPSAFTKGDLAARVLMRYPKSLLARLAVLRVKQKHGGHLRRPIGDNEALSSFFDPHDYYSLIDKNLSLSYKDYIDQIISSISSEFINKEAALLYLKNYGFIQGSDNQVVIQSARAAGFEKVFLPFATSGFIKATIQYQSRFFETVTPKYVVRDLLKKAGYKLSGFVPDSTGEDFTDGENIIEMVEQRFFETAATASNLINAALTDQ